MVHQMQHFARSLALGEHVATPRDTICCSTPFQEPGRHESEPLLSIHFSAELVLKERCLRSFGCSVHGSLLVLQLDQ